MEKRSRKKFSSSFKSKVALEAVKGLKTINEIASEYGLQPSQVSEWKRVLIENMAELFEKKSQSMEKNFEKEKEELLKIIGSLKVDNDFYKKKLKPYL
ncbi:MAG: transposase [Bacteroidales bacterium]|jgi:transposase-like protein